MNETVLPRPRLILDRHGKPCPSLLRLLQPSPITAFVGGGGKTSTMLALALELCQNGARVIVTTTTHIWPVKGPLPVNLRVAGIMQPSGKLGPVDHIERLKDECDYLLIESDGSRSLPAKAPADHEPALLDETEQIIAVQGLTAFYRPIEAVCHRVDHVCALLGKSLSEPLLPADGARLLLSPQGQRKNVGDRRYAVVLNQADGDAEQGYALEIAARLPEDAACAITAYHQEKS